MYKSIILVITISIVHILLGIICLFTGVLSSIQALVWIAHTVSPIWSGAFVSAIIWLCIHLTIKKI